MTDTPSLTETDERSKSVQNTPWRVSLSSMKRQIEAVEYIHPKLIPHMTIALIVLKNGYVLQGMSAPADPSNYNEAKGREFAYEDALRKMWPLEAFVMRDYLSGRIDIPDADARWQE